MGNRNVAEGLDSGAVKLYDGYQPGLSGGRHRLVVQQTVDLENGEVYHYYRDQSFVVKAPRFQITAGEVHSRFPPEGGQADYRRFLPFVVFKNRALPWERSVGGGVSLNAPWLALLSLTQVEFDRAGGNSMLKRVSVKSLLAGDQGSVMTPELTPEGDDEADVQVLDLPLELFKQVAPSADDLPYLAHLRAVNTDDKVKQDMSADGEYAVVVGNRLPRPGNNLIFLVSLEGWGGVLIGQRSGGAGAIVRLVSPLRWSFFTNPDGRDTFAGLSSNLSLGVYGDGENPSLELAQAHAAGYRKLPFQSSDPNSTHAWYRGPFAPESHSNQDSLMGVRLPGGEDASYAAAFQLGRLLALSSQHFVNGLRRFLDARGRQRDTAQRLSRFLESQVFMEHEAAGQGGELTEQLSMGRSLIDWLARLVLLYPVPFHYLVPDELLLPWESLRFFEVDNQWLNALGGGALSTAVQSRRDRRESESVAFESALSQVVYAYRAQELGLHAPSQTGDFMAAKKSGFLLRSKLVSDWPGLEVVVEVDGALAQSNLLRLDHLGDGVLLGLARGRISRVTLREPREGLRLGLDSQGRITPRMGDKPSGGAIPIWPDLQRSGAGANVLDIQAAAQRLGTLLEQESFGSAALALQLLVAPESQPLVWN